MHERLCAVADPSCHPSISTEMGFLHSSSEKRSSYEKQESYGGPSMPSGPPPAYPAVYACILLSRSDRLRLCGFPESVIGPVNDAVSRVWTAGIQRHGMYEGTYEWKFKGNPWYGQGVEAVHARRLLVHVLHALAAVGWMLHTSCDMTKKSYDKDTLFFRACPPVQRYFFSISFNESDKVRIIDAPNDMTRNAFTSAVSTWQLGIQDSKEKEPGCWQLKLRGNPWWSSDGTQVIASKVLACNILSAMDNQGFDLVGSVDMSMGTGENQTDLDTWFFASKV